MDGIELRTTKAYGHVLLPCLRYSTVAASARKEEFAKKGVQAESDAVGRTKPVVFPSSRRYPFGKNLPLKNLPPPVGDVSQILASGVCRARQVAG